MRISYDPNENNLGKSVGCGILIFLIGWMLLLAFNDQLGMATIIGIILILIGCIRSGFKKTSNRRGRSSKPRQSNKLEIRAQLREDTHEGISFDLYEFQLKGEITPKFITNPVAKISLFDVSDPRLPQPVYAHNEALQAKNSRAYEGVFNFETSLNSGATLSDWVSVIGVPEILLDLPYSGARKIRVDLKIYDKSDGSIKSLSQTHFEIVSKDKGYLEIFENESTAHAESLKLAMCIAASDGRFDHCEVEVIKRWGDKMVADLNSAQKNTKRDILNEALSYATDQIRLGRREQLEAEAARNLHAIGEKPFLYEAYELCLHVLKADGEAHPEELAQLSRISKQMGLDEAKVRLLSNTHLADVEVTITEDASSNEKILGITPDMSVDEIKRHLRKESKKYQSRSTHKDEKIRKQAKKMLDLIGDVRAQYSSQ